MNDVRRNNPLTGLPFSCRRITRPTRARSPTETTRRPLHIAHRRPLTMSCLPRPLWRPPMPAKRTRSRLRPPVPSARDSIQEACFT